MLEGRSKEGTQSARHGAQVRRGALAIKDERVRAMTERNHSKGPPPTNSTGLAYVNSPSLISFIMPTIGNPVPDSCADSVVNNSVPQFSSSLSITSSACP